jgi:hypothetical protein
MRLNNMVKSVKKSIVYTVAFLWTVILALIWWTPSSDDYKNDTKNSNNDK